MVEVRCESISSDTSMRSRVEGPVPLAWRSWASMLKERSFLRLCPAENYLGRRSASVLYGQLTMFAISAS